MLKMKRGGWKFLIVSLLVAMASAVICLLIGVPAILANTIPAGIAAISVFSLKAKWLE